MRHHDRVNPKDKVEAIMKAKLPKVRIVGDEAIPLRATYRAAQALKKAGHAALFLAIGTIPTAAHNFNFDNAISGEQLAMLSPIQTTAIDSAYDFRKRDLGQLKGIETVAKIDIESDIKNNIKEKTDIETNNKTDDIVKKEIKTDKKEIVTSNQDKNLKLAKEISKKDKIRNRILQMAEEASEATGVDSTLIMAIIEAESAGRQKLKSKVGAVGMMQLMPETAKMYGVDRHNAEQNVLGGAMYMADLLERFEDQDSAIAAYNAGPTAVAKYKGIPPFKETKRYVKKVNTFMDNKEKMSIWPREGIVIEDLAKELDKKNVQLEIAKWKEHRIPGKSYDSRKVKI